MAVERMVMLSVVGRLENMEDILFEVLQSGTLDMVDAMTQLSENSNIYSLEDNVEMVVDLNNLAPFPINSDVRQRTQDAKKLVDYFKIDDLNLSDFDPNADVLAYYKELMDRIGPMQKEYDEILKRLDDIAMFEENLALFENVDVDLKKIKDLNYFSTRFGRLEKSARVRLKSSYENLLALIFHTGSFEDEEVYMITYPNEVSEEIDRVLKSLHWIDVPILDYAKGTPRETLREFREEEEALHRRLKEIEKERDQIYNDDRDKVRKILAHILFLGRVEEAKEKMAVSKKYFLMTGWTDEAGIEEVRRRTEKYPDVVLTIQEEDTAAKGITPPTKLTNPKFFKPFELLVRMYGIPKYNEIDPTVFVGITYLLLFGAMFGDVGQGLIFVLIGWLVSKKKQKDMGGLLMRMGGASVIFGFLYGSVFGNEEIIDALWMRPFQNIEQVLAVAIGFGVVLLVLAYGMNFANAIKNKDLARGLFGEHGLFGFLVFAMLLIMILDVAGVVTIVPMAVAVAILVLSILLMIFKKPIMAKMQKTEVQYEGGKSGYFIESSFSMIELLISTLSGIVSFIRVGAFAINHVGLFMAFHTMAQMAPHNIGGVIILILGNILIIGLEGLIVFIQGLRLEYYELFSRYYSGSGREFKSDSLSLKNH
ncbi:V-type ATPase subunit family protein [Aedoeadaptatus nemausensis]|uniref:V-type ATPase subunit family protein n=1 Tax=Aedoeadaptatus nemausensis TaxID=2582829 RepID=A0A6V6Y220_9FIRM|nr:V-type ATPase 116kDa subunit family protein [Peptoniphilus nemausensis]CAC9929072.1 V-type ATPase subunit family protein [Peptoniphilus nemausensis]